MKYFRTFINIVVVISILLMYAGILLDWSMNIITLLISFPAGVGVGNSIQELLSWE